MMLFKRVWAFGIVLAGGLAVMLAQSLSTAQPPAPAGRVKIGTYNTRAVALAYGRSKGFLEGVQKRSKEGMDAKAKKDQKKYDEIAAEMSQKQDRLHAQVFSNAPIDDVMASMKDALPGIARKAGVSAIVPEVNYHDPAVEVVDVTDALVQHFKPTAQTQAMIKDLVKHPPVSYTELAKHKD
jgi:Skp family chaperone for outer membrane proteins